MLKALQNFILSLGFGLTLDAKGLLGKEEANSLKLFRLNDIIIELNTYDNHTDLLIYIDDFSETISKSSSTNNLVDYKFDIISFLLDRLQVETKENQDYILDVMYSSLYKELEESIKTITLFEQELAVTLWYWKNINSLPTKHNFANIQMDYVNYINSKEVK